MTSVTDGRDWSPLDYSITGPAAQRAFELGLADADWFQADIDPARLKALSARTDGRAALDLLLWVGLLVGSGLLAWRSLGSWWMLPTFAIYGAMYGSAADPRWHECGHGTAFRSAWMNEAVYAPSCFFLARLPTWWRWSHFRHHSDTIIVGRDAEIVFARPLTRRKILFAFTHLAAGPQLFAKALRHAFGMIDDDSRELIPPSELRRLVLEARVFVTIWVATIATAVITMSVVPLLFIGGPTIFGAWLLVFFGLTQHAGLAEDVLDHRYSTRTVYMNPVFRFLYLNMNYHVEHHMYPSVPYHQLPALHDEIKGQLAPAAPSTIAAYREIFEAARRQRQDPDWNFPDRGVPSASPSARRARITQSFEGKWDAVEHPGAGWVAVGPEPTVTDAMASYEVGGRHLLIARLSGETVVTDAMCTHGKANLADGVIVDGELECPRHNGRFNARTGEPTRRPCQQALTTWPCEVRAGTVFVHLSP